MFLMTEPDQYIYNPSFHLKMVFLAVAGGNAFLFYLLPGRHLRSDATVRTPRIAKVIAFVSLTLWLSIMVSGRLITFYRPGLCEPEGPGFIADCIPRR
jgi:hypothetical protein